MFRNTMVDETCIHSTSSLPVSSKPDYPGRRYRLEKMPSTEAKKLRQQGRYAEAEQAHLLAVAEAEKFGPEDRRLALSLNELAALYHTTGRLREAEPLYRRALAIWERSS